MPIGGATAPEEGGKGSELGEFNVSVGSSSSPGEVGIPLGTHVPHFARHSHPDPTPHGRVCFGQPVGPVGQYKVGLAKASDAIPKKIAKQSIKAAILFTNLYNP